jgi:hypothetical protein
VWDYQPNADDLLQMRLVEGWTPTATGTVDGDKVLGHAACLVTKLQ